MYAAIRSWWEVPCIAHYCYVFSKPFKLPQFDIEVRITNSVLAPPLNHTPLSLQELEDTLFLDEPAEDPTPSLLVQLYCNLLNGIVDKDIT